MMKDDEKELFRRLWTEHEKGILNPERRHTYDIIDEMGIPYKRAEYILFKWTYKFQFWEYGVTCFGGWFIEPIPPQYLSLLLTENENYRDEQ